MDEFRRSFVRTFATGPGCRLFVENRNGLVSVRGQDVAEVTVRATARLYADSAGEADREVERIERSTAHEGERVEVRTPDLYQPRFFFFGGPARVDYEITAPEDTALSIEARNGRVDVRGVSGAVEIENRNGGVRVAEVARPVRILTRNGRVDVTSAGADVEVRSTNGAVSIERADGRVTVETTNGPLTISQVAAGAKLKTTNGPIHYRGRVAKDLDIETVNGPVRLAVPRDSRFQLDAESMFGPVRSDLPVRPAPGQATAPAGQVRLRSVHGPIHIAAL